MQLVLDVPDELLFEVAADADGDVEDAVVDGLRLWDQLRNPEEILAEAPPVSGRGPGSDHGRDTTDDREEVTSA